MSGRDRTDVAVVVRTPVGHEPQGARAEAANRPRRDFEDEHPARVDPALGMDRPVMQADGARRAARPRVDDRIAVRRGGAADGVM